MQCSQFFQKRTKLTSPSNDDSQISELYSFFGRIEETINFFRDLLNFKVQQSKATFKNLLSKSKSEKPLETVLLEDFLNVR